MKNHGINQEENLNRQPFSRPTIGLLIGRLGDHRYQAYVWPGVADVARERGANLICFVGGTLRGPSEFDAQRNIAYDLASPANVDGLVTMSGSLAQFIGLERLGNYFTHYRPLPIVSIALAMDNIPSVVVDNTKGMHDLVCHLIEVHGFRRIAFIRGPESNPEANQRYLTYQTVLAEHGIALDPDLVAPGDFLSPAGAEAVQLLIDQRKVHFDAIVSGNDEMALGVLAALKERGKRVPEDVCVVGFDNIEEARFASPPLTTIHQPLYEQGRYAAEMLLDMVAGKVVPEKVTLPTELVIRRSCGCLSPAIIGLKDSSLIETVEKVDPNGPDLRQQALSAIKAAAGNNTGELDNDWAASLLDAFLSTLKNPAKGTFLPDLDRILRLLGTKGHDIMQWQDSLPGLRTLAMASADIGRNAADIDALLQQALAIIIEISLWAQAYRRIQAERSALDFNTMISEPLMTAFDIAGLTDVVASQLPQMGIRSCYLSLYERVTGESQAGPAEWSRLILGYNARGRLKLDHGGKRFLTSLLVPDGILSQDEPFAVMLEPLHFRDETQLGFVLFEPLQTREGELRDALSRQISTALKGALLLQERENAEVALQRSENDYRSLLEFNHEILKNAAIGIIRLDKELRIQYLNPEMERIIGLSAEETLKRAEGKDIRTLSAIQEIGLIPYLDVLQAGKDIFFEAPFISYSGKETFIHITGSPIHENGAVVGSVLLIEDVSKRKQTEEALNESKERYRAVIETTDTGYVVIDEQGQVIDANMNYVRISGHANLAEILGRRVAEWTAPHDLDRNLEAISECFSNGGIQNLVIDYLHPDGLVIPVEINGSRVQTRNGKQVVTLCRDISERKQTQDALASSEQRYRILAEASHDMIFIIGKNGIVEYVNEFASKQFGLEPEFLIGEKIISLFSQAEAARQSLNIQRVMETAEPMYIEESTKFPGGDKWLGTWLVPLRHQAGQQDAIMGVSRDITARIRADLTLKQYSERLEEMVGDRTAELQEALQKAQMADKLKSEFIANINHELRTPLTNLVLYHQMLKANPIEKTSQRLDVIGREIQRLRILIEDMLKLSRLDSREVAFRPLPQDLNRIIQTLVNDRSIIAQEHGINLTLDLQPDLPSIWLDEVLIVQVVSNLMTNALNYTPEGGQVHISTCSKQDGSGNPGVAFIVQDTGPGISPEDLPHLFERFYRGKAGHSTGIPGTGLGLAIVKQMIEIHHGWIEVKSAGKDPGAGFTVWLPETQAMGGF
jgi:PAS domain S-box-containing protein